MVYFYWLVRRKCPARPSSDGPSLCLIHGTVLSPSNIITTYLHTPYKCLKTWKILDVRFNMSQTVSWDIPNSFSVHSKSAKFHAKSTKVDQTTGVQDLNEVSCPIMPYTMIFSQPTNQDDATVYTRLATNVSFATGLVRA